MAVCAKFGIVREAELLRLLAVSVVFPLGPVAALVGGKNFAARVGGNSNIRPQRERQAKNTDDVKIARHRLFGHQRQLGVSSPFNIRRGRFEFVLVKIRVSQPEFNVKPVALDLISVLGTSNGHGRTARF